MGREAVAVHCGLRQWPAVRAWLSTAPVPVASLHLAAADGRAAQQLSQLLCSPHFQQVCAPPHPHPPHPCFLRRLLSQAAAF